MINLTILNNFRASGRADLTVTLPHTITTWYLYAHTISSASSVCTVESLPVKVYNSMYVRVKIPNAIHVQDQVQLHVIIYNFERESLPVSILCKYSYTCTRAY